MFKSLFIDFCAMTCIAMVGVGALIDIRKRRKDKEFSDKLANMWQPPTQTIDDNRGKCGK